MIAEQWVKGSPGALMKRRKDRQDIERIQESTCRYILNDSTFRDNLKCQQKQTWKRLFRIGRCIQ
jgi:hypothetical protein